MNKIILHIPHSSMKLNRKFWKHTIIEKAVIKDFVKIICDYKTNEIFASHKYKVIKPKYSRVFCDVEKFADDSKEIMSKYGLGMIYTKTNTGREFLRYDQEYRNSIYTNYYQVYHNKLNKIVEKELESQQDILLIDCHSFSKDIIMDKSKTENLPDVCIGHNLTYNKKLIEFIQEYFVGLGYKVAINYPYDGAIIPNLYINNQSNNLHSVMIELNKNIYINNIKSLKKIISNLFVLLEQEKFSLQENA